MMVEQRDIQHNKVPEELKRAAIAELERRGYDVRGKTPGQVRQMLKRWPRNGNQTKNGLTSNQENYQRKSCPDRQIGMNGCPGCSVKA